MDKHVCWSYAKGQGGVKFTASVDLHLVYPNRSCPLSIHPSSTQLAACRQLFDPILPEGLYHIDTPLLPSAWKKALANHPDTAFADHVLQGIRHGFWIGFDYCHYTCTSSQSNMLSTLDNPSVVDEYLQKELSEGNIAELGDPACVLGLQVSPFGVIPKRHSSNKWPLIVDLSSPKGSSVNNGIKSGAL